MELIARIEALYVELSDEDVKALEESYAPRAIQGH